MQENFVDIYTLGNS